MSPVFIHLRLHTEYSLNDSLIRIPNLIKAAIDLNMPAIAITDQCNLFAAVKFYQAAIAAGIKPIIGADCWLENEQQPQQAFRCTLLCQDGQGYRNLIHLVSRAHLTKGPQAIPVLYQSWLKEHNTGLIVLSGGAEGDIGQALLETKQAKAQVLLDTWLGLFPERFYLELQRIGKPQEETYLALALNLAQASDVPVVATNDVCFLTSHDFEAHEARTCIQTGYLLSDPERPQKYSQQQYLRTPAEMETLFKDIPTALINTVEIAKRCNLELPLNKTFLPKFSTPTNITPEVYLVEQAEQGLIERLREFEPSQINTSTPLTPTLPTWQQPYFERLANELKVINTMGFASYFLIVADFIRWAKKQHIPVGPGRGSGAGSLVAYALQITDLDPLRYDLLFERFLNPERISMPDFDIDFCMEGRDRVIEYVMQCYSQEAVAQIITFGSMAARAVLRDVGRVLAYPYGMVDKIAKLVPFEPGITLDKALQQEIELKRQYDNDGETKALIDLASKLEGLARNISTHAGGVVIAPSKLTDFTPLYCEADTNQIITQFDKDDIEAVGLVKFDFLGLRTLTIIDWAIKAINQNRLVQQQSALAITHIPLNDNATFNLLKTCKTAAIFQLESYGMQDLVKRLQPDCFEDIVALVALFRPGPLQSGMVDDFINRKHGRIPANYLHPLLEPILRSTYGIILYQEQVMQIAQVLAGYSLGAADLLRRAMGKKKAEEMAKQRAIFIAGAQKKAIDSKLANQIFNLMEKFAGYGFNKSHSVAYALITYQTAWLKTHYPAEFMAAVLSSDMDHTEKVVASLAECRALKIKIIPPHINHSEYSFVVTSNAEIIYGLGAIKGIGLIAIEAVLEQRRHSGHFQNLLALCRRVNLEKVNRRTLEALIYSGSLDGLAMNRASLMANLGPTLQIAEQELQAKYRGQQNLFAAECLPSQPVQQVPDWPLEKRLQDEKAVLGFYLSGHPLEKYEAELAHFTTGSLAKVSDNSPQAVVVAGWLVSWRVVLTKRGNRMVSLILEDRSGRLECTLFSETYTQYRHLLQKDSLLVVEADLNRDDRNLSRGIRLIVKRILDITQAREHYAYGILLTLVKDKVNLDLIASLQAELQTSGISGCPILIDYHTPFIQVRLHLGPAWRIQPSDDRLQALDKLFGQDSACVLY